MTQFELKFPLQSEVKILPLEGLKGKIVGAFIDSYGNIEYSVKYFYNCEKKSLYFTADELVSLQSGGISLGMDRIIKPQPRIKPTI